MVQGSNPGGGEISSPVQTSSRAYLSSHTMTTESFLEVKWPGHGFNHTPPTSTEVKESIYLNFCSPPGPSWSVPGEDLSYTPNMHQNLSENLQNLIPKFFFGTYKQRLLSL